MKTLKQILCFILSLIIALGILSSCGGLSSVSGEDPAGPKDTDNGEGTLLAGADDGADDEATDTQKPEPAKAPDPDFYLNTSPESTVDEYRVYAFKGDPTKAAQNYVSLLENEYGLTLTESYSDGTTLGWHLQKGENENADVDISVNCTGGINWELWLSLGSDVELSAAETWDEPIVPVISSPTLPSPDAFFDHKLGRNEDFYSEKDEKHVLSFKADIDTGTQAMEEYVSLLFSERYKLELAFEAEETILYIQNHRLGFNFTVGDQVSDVVDEDEGYAADVFVYVQRNARKETALLTFYFKPDAFEFTDFGDRTSYSPVDFSGKAPEGGSTDGSFGGHGSALECTSCDGSGECSTCRGDGYLHSSASGKEDRNCYKCHPNYGKCPDCHGTGKRN